MVKVHATCKECGYSFYWSPDDADEQAKVYCPRCGEDPFEYKKAPGETARGCLLKTMLGLPIILLLNYLFTWLLNNREVVATLLAFVVVAFASYIAGAIILSKFKKKD